MGRRLAEAAKAWRARRTRGEIGLRRVLVLAFFELAFFEPVDFLPLVVDEVACDARLLLFVAVFVAVFAVVLAEDCGDDSVEAGGCDCAPAGNKKPS